MDPRYTGSCLCGAVDYAVHGPLRDVWNCHCERCRKFTGHHMAATSTEADAVVVDDPGSQLTWFAPVPEAEYAFCRRYGASLFWRAASSPERLSVCAGTLDPPTGLHTTRAIWVSQASDYYQRADVPELPFGSQQSSEFGDDQVENGTV